ncbi:MAG: hypothetical protein CMP10_06005 [Zetaproteobacteria bacterium]|nr:hypothetical protein [Pseudobdellovibrionaceae bacterium]
MIDQMEIRNRLERFLTAAEKWDPNGYAEFFSIDAVKVDPNGSDPVKGRDAIVTRYRDKRMAKLSSWEIQRDDIFVAGQGAALRWTVHLEDKQGEKASYEGIDTFAFNNAGECCEMITFPRKI